MGKGRSEMDDPRVPNLEEMDEQQVRRFLTELLPKLSPEEEYELRHEDYVMEMPQSGERIRGRENMRAFQEAYSLREPWLQDYPRRCVPPCPDPQGAARFIFFLCTRPEDLMV
jgi:hypothetical protein